MPTNAVGLATIQLLRVLSVTLSRVLFALAIFNTLEMRNGSV